MSSPMRNTRGSILFTLTAVIAACGGGGGSGDSGLPPLPAAQRPDALTGNPDTTMSCVAEPVFNAEGASTAQCSGATVLRTDNGVSITRSGVQAYGISTSDLAVPNANPGGATGLRVVDNIANGTSVAEVRLGKSAINGPVRRSFLLLDNLNVRWDGTNERPRIVEAFETTRGITRLESDGSLSIGNALPVPPDAFYDYNPANLTGTQANYANNRYFPAPGCTAPCPVETAGLSFAAGTTGDPDRSAASRNHGDGDIRAGNPGGLPSPATKGFRNITNFSYLYSNLAGWVTQETNLIDEWTPPGQPTEHTVNRRGLVAYGATTANGAVPTSGSAVYRGIAYGYYSPNGEAGGSDPVAFRAAATLEANFSTGQVEVRVNTAVEDGTQVQLPIAFRVNAGAGAANTNVANYMTGPVADGGAGMSGGVGARFFGPAVDEIAGTFVLQNATSKAVALGGFVAKR